MFNETTNKVKESIKNVNWKKVGIAVGVTAAVAGTSFLVGKHYGKIASMVLPTLSVMTDNVVEVVETVSEAVI